MSGFAPADLPEEGVGLEDEAFLEKSFSVDDLLKAVRPALDDGGLAREA